METGIIIAVCIVAVYFFFIKKKSAEPKGSPEHARAFKNFRESHSAMFQGNYGHFRSKIVDSAEKVFFEKIYDKEKHKNPEADVLFTIFYAICGNLSSFGKYNMPKDIGTTAFLLIDDAQQFGSDILSEMLQKKIINMKEFDHMGRMLLDSSLKAAGTDLDTMFGKPH